MRIVLLLLVALAGISCSKPEPANLDVAKQQVKLGQHDPKQYSLLNDQMVYNHRFAEIFGLDPAQAIELDPGVLAIRIYWTVFANRQAVYEMYEPHEYKDKLPAQQIQLFLDDNIPVQLLRNEGTLYNYESFVRSGFRYFPHTAPLQTESMWQQTYSEFYNRIFLSSDIEDKATTSTLNRYKRNMVSGVTALELAGGLFNAPFAIFLYIGDKPASAEIMVPQQDLAARSTENYDPTLFFRVRVPDELTPVLNQPYRQE
ncbi:hypothetical protein [Rheinheimera sp. MMS21-TC3]|uniref:hypothetical protein n=1 Tax=Rheinheimera sp. MMS21-TC3 TaxID=3072790 RepID=UPI0028C47FB8|nr:hypothetical protein [Rheinheimera sp. MMS21-TC3]WNO59598.1 hypothetical protein RDV63_01110 [Rheinheimera sp. MMS21-TC3]